MITAEQTRITPMISRALRSFGKARAAITAGDVTGMIGHLTRGAELLEALDREARPVRRPRKKSAS